MKDRFSFDKRVAGIYDRQRTHPPEVAQNIGAAIAKEANTNAVDDVAQVLEIGVGTGRIAFPVAAAGCHVNGIDLSEEMLTAVAQADHERVDLLQSDMHHLPFPDNSFDAVLAVHVLHLAKDWQLVMREIARVLRPNGVMIQGDDWIDPQSVVGDLRNTLRRVVVELAPDFMPPAAGISKADYLAQLGGTEVTEAVAAEWVLQVSPNERMQQVEQKTDAESWILPQELFDEVVKRLYAYARDKWDDMDAPQPVTRRFILKATRGNW